VKAGATAGTINAFGYRQVTLNGRTIYANYLAWIWMVDREPDRPVIFGSNKSDLRWSMIGPEGQANATRTCTQRTRHRGSNKTAEELEATTSNSSQNAACDPHTTNTTKKALRRKNTEVTGVKWSNTAKKWQAHSRVNGQFHYLGLFEEFKDAVRTLQVFEADRRLLVETCLIRVDKSTEDRLIRFCDEYDNSMVVMMQTIVKSFVMGV
jgi:hypothetical protein